MAGDVDLTRITMQPGAERVTGEIEILASDGKVGLVWDTTLADRQNPDCCSEGIIEASPDNWQTVLTHSDGGHFRLPDGMSAGSKRVTITACL